MAINAKKQEMTNTVAKSNSIVAIYESNNEAEAAVKELQKHGIDMKNVSMVGAANQTGEDFIGFYNEGQHMTYQGRMSAFWACIGGLLFGAGLFFIPLLGPIVAAGPLVGWIVGSVECAVLVGGLSAFAAALSGIGIPEASIANYESAVKTGKFMLIVHSFPEEANRARVLLEMSNPETLEWHQR